MATSESELNDLLTNLESDRSERKEGLTASSKSRVAEAICAFSNDLPGHNKAGVVFVGATDDGNLTGTPITDSMLLELAALRSDGNILPLPHLTVRKMVLSGRNGRSSEVAVVETEPSPAPPVRYKGQVWVRIGPRRGIASRGEERVLNERRRWRDLPYDQHPLPSFSLAELDRILFDRVYLPAAAAAEVIEQNERSYEQQLASLRLYSLEGNCPTVAGALIVGHQPHHQLPGAYIQFVRHQGTGMADLVTNQQEIQGPLPDLIKRLDDIMKANIRIPIEFLNVPLEIQRPEYPLQALQQLTRNAVMHRNYETSNAPVRLMWFDDRVEIHSPGGPYGEVNAANFGQPGLADYRNPVLAEAMKNLKLVQRFGVGIATAQRDLALNHNRPAEFLVESTRVVAKVYKRREGE